MSQRHLQVEIPVPPFFVCPISLELMRDPVTLSSGQTFDRSSIEQWLDNGHSSCPITRQAFQLSEEPIPNHALRRLIQAWCVENRSLGIDRIATPRQPASLADIHELICEIDQRNANVLNSLRALSTIAQTRPRTLPHMLKAGVLPALASSLSQSVKCSSRSCSWNDCFTPRQVEKTCETLRLLALLIEADGAALSWETTLEQILSVAWYVARGKMDAKQNAALILNGIQMSDDTKRNIGGMEGFMDGLLQLITMPSLSPKVSTAGLQLLLQTSASSPNRVRAIEAGAVDALVDLLASDAGKITTELVLEGLELLSGCAEGRAAICKNARSIEEVVRSTGRVSPTATRHALETLWVVMKMVPSSWQVEKRAVKAGAFMKVIAVAQSKDFCSQTSINARRILKALSFHLHDDPAICLTRSSCLARS